ncbi:MAG: DNA polymerase III subunit alpha [Bdellovibrionales bacterium]|nr:DNA polymerase III subunit alpha [Bdellovibrionales bacterium]
MSATASFVHLHLHTQYSLLEGAIRLETLFDHVKALGMDSVAMTDSQNLFGAMDFYHSARAVGIKPLIGCELHCVPQFLGAPPPTAAAAALGSAGAGTRVTDFGPKFHTLVVLCKDLTGYRNLCQMVTQSSLKMRAAVVAAQANGTSKSQSAAPTRALVDRELLERYGEGLVVLSGGLRGEIPYRLLFGDQDGASELIAWMKKRFGSDFYLEIEDTGLPEQEFVNEELSRLAQKHELKLVGSSNCHYLKPEDAEAQEVLQCIEAAKNLDFNRPKSLVPNEYWVKPPELMRERLERFPGAYENTAEVAAKCNLEFQFKDEKGRKIYHLPDFRPEGVEKSQPFDTVAYFKDQARKGLQERFESHAFVETLKKADWTEKKKEYEKRLEEELVMIERTGFSGYFLVVADFIGWAKRHEIPVGPGRGSGAGSLVAYSLKITDIDPIPFNLLFERFINPERISMPDFDIDFCQDRRGEVIEYVERKYGKDNVCQIITFGKLQAKACVKDVGRVLGLSFSDTDQITKLFPDVLNIEIAQAIEQEPRLRERMDMDPKIAKVMEYALALEGLYRNSGIHAAGVIITEQPVVNYCPLLVTKDGDVVTQFDKDKAEDVGLVKFDFLGLKTLTVIDNAVKLVRSVAAKGSADSDFSIETINYSDPEVFALISSGDTDGVFQVESSGMKDLCSRLQPGSLEDITAINALYRPGPLNSGMVDDFVDRKHGRKPIVYEVDQLAPILKDTYGVIVYQEQVMQIARELAGYSLGQADLLRRAMGKKKPEEMAKHSEIFIKGATEKGLDPIKAKAIFDLMAMFAEYGFNKSHSAAYGVLTYQTAFLKRYYPAEFMAALMTTEMDATEKLTKYISDARAHGIQVLTPDVNKSERKFSVERLEDGTKAIRFGLEAIKGVGGSAVDSIMSTRTENPFRNVLDFSKRVSTRKVNKKVLESLTVAGAFDAIAEVNRPSILASLEKILEAASDEQAEREMGQNSLFDSFSSDEVKLVSAGGNLFTQVEDWPESRRLTQEKQVVGFYVSGHPMDRWQKVAEGWLGWTIAKLKRVNEDKAAARAKGSVAAAAAMPGPDGRYQRPPKTEIKLCGLLGEVREVMTKKGSRMAFGQIEDLDGKIEVVFFPEAYQQLGDFIKQASSEANPVVLTGEIEWTDEAPKVLAKSLDWAEEAHKTRVQRMVLHLDPSVVSIEQLRALKQGLLGHRGKCPVVIEFQGASFRTSLALPGTIRVDGTPQLAQVINQIFGRSVVSLH